MKESYCGLCDQCQLDNPEFLEAVAKVKASWTNFGFTGGRIVFGATRVFPCLNSAGAWSGFSPIPHALGAEAAGGWIAAPSGSAPSIGGMNIVLSVPTWRSVTALT